MAIVHRRITILTLSSRPKDDLNERLQWFGNAIGLFNQRDKDKSCFRIFIQLLNVAKRNAGLTSDELAFSLRLSRGTVIHHINKLMEAGIVITEDGKYFLRVNNLEALVDEIEADMQKALSDLRATAKAIDTRLEL